ncbi:MAG TPA: recombinase family protein, partial [Reyranella sp.]|nr:recombinase family protein [Reyranella sp.]
VWATVLWLEAAEPYVTVIRRCAVYTRKSTEEGLEQSFNSLHAQREACEAYIKSQSHEGWRLMKTAYDDGGLSGGNLDRPALKQLLADVAAGQVHIIVVYKVDRLTRSLADFAKIVDVLDGHGASFVSVTQQFNTTTSMGRLTLNVLLSFAQFEREVASERIRDKIAASRRKGMWMGGTVPLGYDVKDRALVVDEAEAATVREIYEAYLRLSSVAKLRAELDRRGIVSKRRKTTTGRTWGGCRFDLGALYWLLRNPVYVGRVSHRGQVYQGQQEPIVDLATWERVQQLLAAKTAGRERRRIIPGGRLLAGRLFDDCGNAMSPAYTVRRGKRHAYYVSQALFRSEREKAGSVPRVPADEIERLVRQAVAPTVDADNQNEAARKSIERVVVFKDRIEIRTTDAGTSDGGVDGEGPRTIVVPARLAHRNRARILDDGAPRPDSAMVRAIGRAHEWRTWLEQEEVHSYRDIAAKAAVNPGYVQAVLPLAFLEPRLTRELLDGRRQINGGLMELLRRGIPIDWRQQRASF